MNPFPLKTSNHRKQMEEWPSSGRHIMAQYDADHIVVYQAYRPEIGRYGAEHQVFGGPFKFTRMSWIKPNFLWMMYRSGWGTKEGQETTLAVTIPCALFEDILIQAVPSTYAAGLYPDEVAWKQAVSNSEVRLQWDPDHGPNGQPLERRAIQLGLRGDMLRRYAETDVVRIDDISDFVAEQREVLRISPDDLITPDERVFTPTRAGSVAALNLQTTNPEPTS